MGFPIARINRAAIAAAGENVKKGNSRTMGTRKWGYGSSTEWMQSPEPMSWRRAFAGRADQVTLARQLAVTLFAGTGREDDVALVVTELATNAVRHSRSGHKGGWFGLELLLDDPIYIGVTDQGGLGYPTIRTGHLDRAQRSSLSGHHDGLGMVSWSDQSDPAAEGGRGLQTVARIAIAVGIHGSLNGGHTVWADLELRPQRPSAPDPATLLAS